MKKFKDLNRKMPPGEHVFDKKIKGVSVMIHKNQNKFDVFIDNDKLDSYPNLATAKKMAMQFVQQYKDMK